MTIELIRNATMKLNYGGKRILTDPLLAEKHSMKSYSGRLMSPLVDLPMETDSVIAGIDCCLLSHFHTDHFDTKAQQLLPKDLDFYCQPADQTEITNLGFKKVIAIDEKVELANMTIIRTKAVHGSGEVLKEMGEGSGYVFKADNEPTVYWAGDSIWCEELANTISLYQPNIIITHSCGAVWGNNVPIIMDADQTVAVCQFTPNSVVIAVHMGVVDHGTITRDDLRSKAEDNGITTRQLLIPEDGEQVSF